MKSNAPMRQILKLKALVAGALLLVAVISTLFIAYTVHGDAPIVPPPPTVPTHDTQSVWASDTITAREEQAEQQYATDVGNGVYGTPWPKDKVAPIPSPLVTVAADSTAPPSSGIVSEAPSEEAGWSSKYHITNAWYGPVGTSYVYIYAGSKADNMETATWNSPEQGILIVSGPAMPGNVEYFTPTRSGPVTVTSYVGACVTLTSSMGTQYTFDAQNDSWACSGTKP